ncbi:protein AMBP-like [Hypomesus transpacificus]|uniref:protein AMBP-like n=1 Tax=Hypomesus transpacificus TaxID=137520 RepID=UPI001F078D1F|nr:protein AMBP-like [Hypomesus transpacificus]
MHQGAVVVVLLGLVGVLQGVPLFCKPLYNNQNFDLDRFMGKWYDVAVASNCPLIKQVKGDVAISILELRSRRHGQVSTKRTIWRQGKCKQTVGEYELTNTPGRFTYHVPKWGADVEVNLLHTDYDKYAIVLHTSTERATGKRVTTMKLYSRTKWVANTLTEEFYWFLRELHMNAEMVIIKKDKGQCQPGQPSKEKPNKSGEHKPGKSSKEKPTKSKEKPNKSGEHKPGKSSKEKPNKSGENKPGKSSKEKPTKSKEKPNKSGEHKPGKSSKEKPNKSGEYKPGKSSKEKPNKSAEHKPGKSSKETN